MFRFLPDAGTSERWEVEAALRKRPEERLHRHVQLISHWLGQQVKCKEAYSATAPVALRGLLTSVFPDLGQFLYRAHGGERESVQSYQGGTAERYLGRMYSNDSATGGRGRPPSFQSPKPGISNLSFPLPETTWNHIRVGRCRHQSVNINAPYIVENSISNIKGHHSCRQRIILTCPWHRKHWHC